MHQAKHHCSPNHSWTVLYDQYTISSNKPRKRNKPECLPNTISLPNDRLPGSKPPPIYSAYGCDVTPASLYLGNIPRNRARYVIDVAGLVHRGKVTSFRKLAWGARLRFGRARARGSYFTGLCSQDCGVGWRIEFRLRSHTRMLLILTLYGSMGRLYLTSISRDYFVTIARATRSSMYSTHAYPSHR
jgi:hypothetical protein